MSRFYKLTLSPETATPVGASGPSNNAGATWTNKVNGKIDLGAQTIEFDIHVVAANSPAQPAAIRIWGPSKEQISQASDFNGATITLDAGMTDGLPLASDAARHAGMILKGQVFQAFGNWQGINQTLDFVVVTDLSVTQATPGKFSFNWRQGQPLADTIKEVLSTVYPDMKLTVNISSNLVLTADESGVYQTLEQFASYVRGVSQNIITDITYQGVSIVPANGNIDVFDNAQDSADAAKDASNAAIQLNIQDLIGQVTWLSAQTIQFNTVIRADIEVGKKVTLPIVSGAQAVSTPASGSNVRAKNAFSGTWTIIYMRHVGNSRAPDAQSWITTFQAISDTASAAATSVANSSA